MAKDFLAEIVAERTRRNPEFPGLVAEAETRRKLAWEMTMAGGHQTTGERANVAGQGGWINGRGNTEMTMLAGYARMREFFEKVNWWELEPRPELCGTNALCLAQLGERYVLYLREGGSTALQLLGGSIEITENSKTSAPSSVNLLCKQLQGPPGRVTTIFFPNSGSFSNQPSLRRSFTTPPITKRHGGPNFFA